MADPDPSASPAPDAELEPLEELQARHRREAAALQARTTQKKRAASKKTRRGVNDECAALERALRERHVREVLTRTGDRAPSVEDLPGLTDEEAEEDEEGEEGEEGAGSRGAAGAAPAAGNGGNEPSNTAVRGVETPAEVATPLDEPPLPAPTPKRRNRAKEKLARRTAEQDAAIARAEAEAAMQPSLRDEEEEVMRREMAARGLVEERIAPDGHCLFSAVADQLQQIGVALDKDKAAMENLDKDDLAPRKRYILTRRAAAAYIETHPDDFVPYLEAPLEEHVHNIRDTAEWGGHPELLALARTYAVEICVVQHPGPIAYIRPEVKEGEVPPRIWLSYYRHGYGLGEHYNSLRKRP